MDVTILRTIFFAPRSCIAISDRSCSICVISTGNILSQVSADVGSWLPVFKAVVSETVVSMTVVSEAADSGVVVSCAVASDAVGFLLAGVSRACAAVLFLL